MSDLYDTDIVLWSEEQTARLRRVAAADRLNLDSPDWANIIGEIEDVGGSAVRAVRSLLFQALLHELKAEAWPSSSYVEHWRNEARSFRIQASSEFTPAMRQRIDVAKKYAKARRALPDTIDGQPPLSVSPACPLTLDQMIGDEPNTVRPNT